MTYSNGYGQGIRGEGAGWFFFSETQWSICPWKRNARKGLTVSRYKHCYATYPEVLVAFCILDSELRLNMWPAAHLFPVVPCKLS